MPPIPLEEVPLGTELLSLGVLRIIRDDRYVPAMRSFEQARHLLEVDASGADVILQSEVVALAALRQQTLLDDHIRDDLLGDRSRTWVCRQDS